MKSKVIKIWQKQRPKPPPSNTNNPNYRITWSSVKPLAAEAVTIQSNKHFVAVYNYCVECENHTSLKKQLSQNMTKKKEIYG